MDKLIVLVAIVGISVFLALTQYTAINQVADQSLRSLQPEKKKTEIIVTGDIMLGRTVMTTALDKGDPTYPFHEVGDTLRSADITFVNLENPIISNCPRHTSGFIFCADPRMVEALKYGGVDVVTLANNHSFNYGKQGIDETKEILSASGIEYTGLSNLVIKEVNGTKFGFLGFEKSQLGNPALTTEEQELLETSDAQVNVLIVGMHWGVEYQNVALPGVKKLAGEMVELGADVVVGHHPHWVQDFETIEGKPVYYSLGNFVFDQMWSEETREGMAVKLVFEKDQLVSEKQMRVFMEEWAQPKWTN